MRRLSVLAAILGTGVAVLLPAGADAAAAEAVRCGDLITQDVVLTADLSCPSGNGLVLAGGVTLDLGGHRLVGPGGSARAGTGVLVTTLPESTVRNGRIQGWSRGSAAEPDSESSDAGRLSVHDVTYANNNQGVSVFIGSVRVSNSLFRNNGAGISGFQGSGATITGSSFRDNGVGADLTQTYSARVSTSSFVRNRTGFVCDDVGCPVTDSKFRDNTTAISTWRASVQLSRSEVSGNHVGIDSGYGTFDVATDNRFVGNDTAMRLGAESSARLQRNRFTSNRVAVTDLRDPEMAIREALIESNVLTRNGDAIYLPVARAALRANTATYNTGWGIYAPNAVDLGGNVASRNGQNPQCVGVTC